MENLNTISETWEGFKRQIAFRPAFDKRDADPSKDFGIHGVDLSFYLIGEIGAVQFVVYTNWQLKHVQRAQDEQWANHILCHPLPADLGYHSPVPLYEGANRSDSPCHLLGTDSCYYDGSGLNATPIYWQFVEGGAEAVWLALRDYYESRFSDIPRFEAVPL